VPDDFDGTIQIIEVSEAGVVQACVDLVDDSVVEPVELFTGHITSGEDFVTVGLDEIAVAIVDDG